MKEDWSSRSPYLTHFSSFLRGILRNTLMVISLHLNEEEENEEKTFFLNYILIRLINFHVQKNSRFSVCGLGIGKKLLIAGLERS